MKDSTSPASEPQRLRETSPEVARTVSEATRIQHVIKLPENDGRRKIPGDEHLSLKKVCQRLMKRKRGTAVAWGQGPYMVRARACTPLVGHRCATERAHLGRKRPLNSDRT